MWTRQYLYSKEIITISSTPWRYIIFVYFLKGYKIVIELVKRIHKFELGIQIFYFLGQKKKKTKWYVNMIAEENNDQI